MHNQCRVISREGNLIFIVFLFLFIIKEKKKKNSKKGEIENEITIGLLILNWYIESFIDVVGINKPVGVAVGVASYCLGLQSNVRIPSG